MRRAEQPPDAAPPPPPPAIDLTGRPPRRLCLRVSYDGTDLHGWLSQPNEPRTVQRALNAALSDLLGEPIWAEGASRTDAGVHALDQLAAFTTRHPMRPEGIIKGLNRRLPPTISARAAVEVPLGFVPRFASRGKVYRYALFTHRTPDPLRARFATQLRYPLDPERVAAGLERLVGVHDFTTFAASNGQHKSAVRALWRASLHAERPLNPLAPPALTPAPPDAWVIRFEGEGFLKQMVRNMVGALLEVGRGQWPVERVSAALAARDRSAGGPTAPPQGLSLERTLWP
ncbi:MAG: tRNA pseudouridine(38-40) synthase TruA [Deltaproteobacteria bacterium]|nr:tRNA pseudouridine(38-40) synthase TruA [Deltaproteobacteria bacterium]